MSWKLAEIIFIKMWIIFIVIHTKNKVIHILLMKVCVKTTQNHAFLKRIPQNA